MSVNEKMTAIADNIRSKTGKTELLNLDDMTSGVNEVYEAGYKSFWDSYMKHAHTCCAFAGVAWNKNTFFPTRDFNVGQQCFLYHNWWGSTYNFAERLEECGVKLLSVDPTQTFRYAHVNRLPELDASKSPTVSFDRTFYECRFLVTIDKLLLGDRTGTFSYTFYNCVALKNIMVEGVIPNDISFSHSPLTAESMKSVITHLKDYSADTDNKGKYTLTLKDSCKTLMAEQGEIEEFGGKTYDAYIADIGWNLA